MTQCRIPRIATTYLLSAFVMLTPSFSHEAAPVTLQASEILTPTTAVTRISSKINNK